MKINQIFSKNCQSVCNILSRKNQYIFTSAENIIIIIMFFCLSKIIDTKKYKGKSPPMDYLSFIMDILNNFVYNDYVHCELFRLLE